MKSVFDASFRYKPSFETDVRKTFEKIRREQQAENRRPRPSESATTVHVLQLDTVKKAG